MGKSFNKAKARVPLTKDFDKKKGKVGKMQGRENVTQVSFKSRAIVVPAAAVDVADQPHTHRGQTLEVIIVMTVYGVLLFVVLSVSVASRRLYNLS